MEGQHLLNLDTGFPFGELREPIRAVFAGDPPGELNLHGHNRRGQAVSYVVSFAPLRGELDDAVAGAILLVTADRA